ncbi:hypothetical protein [Amycolatopsis sp.]|uniref:hypothetical protein n=1 Tax=Amycolatopsis sp. TaxID=37632 RepID=UPI002B8C611C|nr:hypothetical protein [Amycolatopsis sp.]HVV11597.1 hypothetical protein [Amycolatopsis sp.]
MTRFARAAIAVVIIGALAFVGITLAHGGPGVDYPTGTNADQRAYRNCMAYYHDSPHCRADVYGYLAVRYGTVSDSKWEALIASGWSGVPGDGQEALYPPVGQ